MSRTTILSAVAAGALLAASAAGIMPATALAGEYDTNAQWCTDQSADLNLQIGACTWLLQSGQLAQDNIPIVLLNRGSAWDDKGEYDRAIEDYTAALRIKPDFHQNPNNLAWHLATAPEARARDGGRAVTLAEKLVSLRDIAANREQLAAAYAEAGRFEDAASAQLRVV